MLKQNNKFLGIDLKKRGCAKILRMIIFQTVLDKFEEFKTKIDGLRDFISNAFDLKLEPFNNSFS